MVGEGLFVEVIFKQRPVVTNWGSPGGRDWGKIEGDGMLDV